MDRKLPVTIKDCQKTAQLPGRITTSDRRDLYLQPEAINPVASIDFILSL
jgi:hypothetical protein